jgi:hypothetical protein
MPKNAGTWYIHVPAFYNARGNDFGSGIFGAISNLILIFGGSY